MQVTVVTPDSSYFDGPANAVVLPAWDGELGSGLILEAEAVAVAFEREVDEVHRLRRFGDDKKDDTGHLSCYEDGSRIELYFSPSDAPLVQGLLPAIHRSRESIALSGRSLASSELRSSLVDAAWSSLMLSRPTPCGITGCVGRADTGSCPATGCSTRRRILVSATSQPS